MVEALHAWHPKALSCRAALLCNPPPVHRLGSHESAARRRLEIASRGSLPQPTRRAAGLAGWSAGGTSVHREAVAGNAPWRPNSRLRRSLAGGRCFHAIVATGQFRSVLILFRSRPADPTGETSLNVAADHRAAIHYPVSAGRGWSPAPASPESSSRNSIGAIQARQNASGRAPASSRLLAGPVKSATLRSLRWLFMANGHEDESAHAQPRSRRRSVRLDGWRRRTAATSTGIQRGGAHLRVASRQ